MLWMHTVKMRVLGIFHIFLRHTAKTPLLKITIYKLVIHWKMNFASVISENVSKHVTTCKLWAFREFMLTRSWTPQERGVHVDSSPEHGKYDPIWKQSNYGSTSFHLMPFSYCDKIMRYIKPKPKSKHFRKKSGIQSHLCFILPSNQFPQIPDKTQTAGRNTYSMFILHIALMYRLIYDLYMIKERLLVATIWANLQYLVFMTPIYLQPCY